MAHLRWSLSWIKGVNFTKLVGYLEGAHEILATERRMDPAVFSPCQRYRYLLRRRVGLSELICLFIMLNPSKADAIRNDPTVRRCMDFAHSWGFGILMVANLFALRSTDPIELKLTNLDPVGPDNDDWLTIAAKKADRIVFGWGNGGQYLGRAEAVRALLKEASIAPSVYLELTQQGEPRHPLYVAKNCVPTAMEL